MLNSPRRHPLHTFQFWFLVLGTVAITVAWRLDLLPFEMPLRNSSSLADSEFVEVELPDATTWGEPEPDAVHTSESDGSPFYLPETASTDLPDPFAAEQAPPAQAFRRTSSRDDITAGDSPVAAMKVNEQSTDASITGSSSPVESGPWWDAEGSNTPPEAETPATQTAEIIQVASREIVATAGGGSFVTSALGTSPNAEYDFAHVDALLSSGKPGDDVDAHRELSMLYWQRPELRPALQARIDAQARRIYFMPQPHYMDPYVVQPGDLLQDVARNYGVSWQYLAKLNRISPQKIRAGQELKVIKGPFSVVVDLSDFELTIHAHGYYVARFPIGVGKDGSTPVGERTVQEKLMDPTYYGPDGVIAHDDPQNPLGEYWIDIGNSFGIHGTIEPDSIGKSLSRGCVRLNNEDVAVVYDLLTIGSSVQIRE